MFIYLNQTIRYQVRHIDNNKVIVWVSITLITNN